MSTFTRPLYLLLIAAVILFSFSCNDQTTPSSEVKLDTLHQWLNWIGEFKPNTDTVTRRRVLAHIVDQVSKVRSKPELNEKDSNSLAEYRIDTIRKTLGDRKFLIVNVKERSCNCDESLLWNLTADIEVDTTSGSVPNPGPVPPKTKVTGDPLDGLTQNEKVRDTSNRENAINRAGRIAFRNYKVDKNAVVAIIDTGIDTMLLETTLNHDIIFEGADGPKNLVGGEDVHAYSDNHAIRHGTIVTNLVLNSFYKASGNQYLPQIMALRAVDKNGEGNLFDFICALSYAIQHHATLINTSMGYYGEPNDVLNKYLQRSTMDSIPVVAAAGNSQIQRTFDICKDSLNKRDYLSDPSRLFFPACVNNNNDSRYDVISVTGFYSPGVPCFYQNYSDSLVTIGVHNQTAEKKCCSYTIDFIKKDVPIEGSSFATPIVSGRLAFNISSKGKRMTVRDYLQILGPIERAPRANNTDVTQNNQYIHY